MKKLSIIPIAAVTLTISGAWAAESVPVVTNMGNVQGGDIQAAHIIIQKKCTSCHSEQRIDAALTAERDMVKIQQEMERKGAKLNANESEVLGIYWKQRSQMKKSKQ